MAYHITMNESKKNKQHNTERQIRKRCKKSTNNNKKTNNNRGSTSNKNHQNKKNTNNKPIKNNTGENSSSSSTTTTNNNTNNRQDVSLTTNKKRRSRVRSCERAQANTPSGVCACREHTFPCRPCWLLLLFVCPFARLLFVAL